MVWQWVRHFFSDKRVSITGLLMFAYAAGIVTAFYIRDSHPVAVIYPGPYALVAIYKGNVYELVPMENSAHAIQVHEESLKQGKKTAIEKVSEFESNPEKSSQAKPTEPPLAPYKTRY